MDIAALILSVFSFVISTGCLVLLLAKRFSTHRVEYVTPKDTLVELDTLPEDANSTAPPVPQKQWTLEEHQRRQQLDELEQHLGSYGDF